MVDADSVMISAIRLVRPSSCPSTVGKGGFSAAGEKAAILKIGYRETYTGSQKTSGIDQAICLPHCHAIERARRQVVAVEVKLKVKVEVKAVAEAKMLQRRRQSYARLNGQ